MVGVISFVGCGEDVEVLWGFFVVSLAEQVDI